MPQELHILRCFSCETFQVDIVKKIPKWCCKMCGEKQSVKKIYGKGTGKECRLLVQKLNEERLTKKTSQLQTEYDSEGVEDPNILKCLGAVPELSVRNIVKKSKWGEFMENTVNAEEENTVNGEEENTVNPEEENKYSSEREVNIFVHEKADFETNKKRKLAAFLENSNSHKSGTQIGGNAEQSDDADDKVNKKSKWTNFILDHTESVPREKKSENHSRRKLDNIFEDDADFDSFLVV